MDVFELIPIYTGALIIWLVLFIRFLILLFKEEFASYWSFMLSLAFIVFFYSCILWNWSNKTEMEVLEPLSQLPTYMVFFPGLFALIFSFVSPSQRILNIVSFALLIAVLISGFLIFIPFLQDPNNFFEIKMNQPNRI
ncbi:MAG: hypothetical protein ACK5B9_12495 [Flavobacteriia bacterium]